MPVTQQKQIHDEEILEVLKGIVDPCSAANGTNFSIVEMGLVERIEENEGRVQVNLRLTAPGCFMVAYFMKEIGKRVGDMDGVETVDVAVDEGLNWEPEMMDPDRRRAYLGSIGTAHRQRMAGE